MCKTLLKTVGTQIGETLLNFFSTVLSIFIYITYYFLDELLTSCPLKVHNLH